MTIPISSEKELARLPVTQTHDILLARMVAREEAAKLGFSTKALTQIATSVSEMTRNVIQHAHAPGQFRIFHVSKDDQCGLMISVEDEGVGIAKLDEVAARGMAGAGIPGCRKLMDEFAIESQAGSGTKVTMIKWSERTQ